jgi:hypothetical protein
MWQNRSLTFKIAGWPLEFYVFRKVPHYLGFEKTILWVFKPQFLKTQFSNGSLFYIWFKIAFFVYEIAIINAPLTWY